MESFDIVSAVVDNLPITTYLMQTWLSIEQRNVPVNHMALNNVTNTQAVGNSGFVTKLQVLLEPIATSRNVVGTWMDVATIADRLLQSINIVRCNAFRICEDLSDTLGYSYLVNPQVRIRRNDGAAREVDTLPGKVTTEATLFSLQSLAETTYWLLAHLRRDSRELGVDVHGDR